MDVPPQRIPRRAFSRIYDLRPRLAVLAALLDDWASRPLHHYLPKWNIDYEDDDDALFPRRPPFELRRSFSAHKPDDGLYWMFDDELLTAGRGGGNGGLRRSQTHSATARTRPRSVDELRSLRRQYLEGRDDQDDGEVHLSLPMTRQHERQVPVQVLQQRAVGGGRVAVDRPMFDRLQIDRPAAAAAARVENRSSPFFERPLSSSPAAERPAPVQVETAAAAGTRTAKAESGAAGMEENKKELPSAGHQPVTRNIHIDLAEADDLSEEESNIVTDGTLVPLSLLENERKTIRELREENLRLKAVVSNLQEVNKRWQTFNVDRQTYIQRLLTTIQEQQDQLSACLDTLRDSRPAPAPAAESGAGALARLRSLQREVAELQRRLEDAKKEHRETVSLLQMQVETHKDDWEAERREKHAAETRLRELSKKVGSDDAHRSKDLSCKCTEAKESRQRSRRSSPRTSPSDERSSHQSEEPRRRYGGDIEVDGATGERDEQPEQERDRTGSQYAFTGEALSNLCGQEGPCFQRRTESPSLSDALTPTPTPTPFQQPNSYPVELSGSASSMGSCPAPHISVPSSSRASTPDPDLSLCSDVTLDCSPPSPIQGTLTVGFDSSGLASVTSFRMRPVPHLATVPGSPDGVEELEDSAGSGVGSGARFGVDEADFWELGAPTNSRENVVCPSCGEVFPPFRHLQFLDHFEVCANLFPNRTHHR